MNRSVFFVWISTCFLCAVVQSQSVPKQIAEPATAAQAAFVLDLTSFPMVNADTDADEGPKNTVYRFSKLSRARNRGRCRQKASG